MVWNIKYHKKMFGNLTSFYIAESTIPVVVNENRKYLVQYITRLIMPINLEKEARWGVISWLQSLLYNHQFQGAFVKDTRWIFIDTHSLNCAESYMPYIPSDRLNFQLIPLYDRLIEFQANRLNAFFIGFGREIPINEIYWKTWIEDL